MSIVSLITKLYSLTNKLYMHLSNAKNTFILSQKQVFLRKILHLYFPVI